MPKKKQINKTEFNQLKELVNMVGAVKAAKVVDRSYQTLHRIANFDTFEEYQNRSKLQQPTKEDVSNLELAMRLEKISMQLTNLDNKIEAQSTKTRFFGSK